MEKTTKKSRKKSKRLKKRIGIIAVGGLSFVLTICLSVGATLAWFAGSTWASKDVYMGGPVYVEMTGTGTNAEGGTSWNAGSGKLDIKADTARSTGTSSLPSGVDASNILLPGQKIQIQSKARVYSTSATTSLSAGEYHNDGSGANTTNTSTNGETYNDNKGRVTTTTSSVLRARFSINIEFDPSVGFNNFTSDNYRDGYPVQSSDYTGLTGVTSEGAAITDKTWQGALLASTQTNEVFKDDVLDSTDIDGDEDKTEYLTIGRRDYVLNTTGDGAWTNVQTTTLVEMPTDVADRGNTELEKIQTGKLKSIYKWRYCSKTEYENTASKNATGFTTLTYAEYFGAADANAKLTKLQTKNGNGKLPKYVQMGYPFNGKDTSTNSNGYYGVWVLEDSSITSGEPATTTDTARFVESSGFYKARTNAYLQTYIEFYENEYGNIVERTIANSLTGLDNALNNYFKTLINDSSDTIISEIIGSTLVRDNDGFYQHDTTTELTDDQKALECASWLYVDPNNKDAIDTNSDEISTSTGGWWYLVSCDYNTIDAGNNINTARDVTYVDSGTNGYDSGEEVDSESNNWLQAKNAIVETKGEFTRGTTGVPGKDYSSTGADRLYAKLFEIKPNTVLDGTDGRATVSTGTNGDKTVYKSVSQLFPFVNGTFALPGDALTNVFANAKISFQISFQALQAFFPYTTSIDGVSYQNNLFGSAKALNIKNAVPIFNEAFDYTETGDGANDNIAL